MQTVRNPWAALEWRDQSRSRPETVYEAAVYGPFRYTVDQQADGALVVDVVDMRDQPGPTGWREPHVIDRVSSGGDDAITRDVMRALARGAALAHCQAQPWPGGRVKWAKRRNMQVYETGPLPGIGEMVVSPSRLNGAGAGPVEWLPDGAAGPGPVEWRPRLYQTLAGDRVVRDLAAVGYPTADAAKRVAEDWLAATIDPLNAACPAEFRARAAILAERSDRMRAEADEAQAAAMRLRGHAAFFDVAVRDAAADKADAEAETQAGDAAQARREALAAWRAATGDNDIVARDDVHHEPGDEP